MSDHFWIYWIRVEDPDFLLEYLGCVISFEYYPIFKGGKAVKDVNKTCGKLQMQKIEIKK